MLRISERASRGLKGNKGNTGDVTILMFWLDQTKSKRSFRLVIARKNLSPSARKSLCLLKNGLGCFLLLVRWITVLAQHTFHQNAQLRANIFAQCPIDRQIVSHSRNQFSGNSS